MRSTKVRDLDDFLAGVATTPEDVQALERVRRFNRLDPKEYLAFLMMFAPRHPPGREIPPRQEPFSL
jgi:hypothetical protein